MTDSRILTCRKCAQPVEVYELPRQFIDPNLFVCGTCLNPKAVPTLLDQPEPETRDYDPTVLCSHAKAEGMPLAVPVFGWGVWKDAPVNVPPAQYLARWNGPFAAYPGDGKEQRYGEWQR